MYLYTLAAASSLPWPFIPFYAPPDYLLVVYQCTRTHLPHAPPWPDHSSGTGRKGDEVKREGKVGMLRSFPGYLKWRSTLFESEGSSK